MRGGLLAGRAQTVELLPGTQTLIVEAPGIEAELQRFAATESQIAGTLTVLAVLAVAGGAVVLMGGRG